MYKLTSDIASMAVKNGFTETMNKGCYALGKSLRPFGFYIGDKKREAGVIDFADFQGVSDANYRLEDEIVEARLEQLKAGGIYIDRATLQPTTKKALVYDYLCSIAICYVEIPKTIKKKGVGLVATYDKFFTTKNPNLMALWTSENVAVVQGKYSKRVKTNALDLMNGKIATAKLNNGKTTSITIPREPLYCEDMNIYPLFTINAFMKGLEGYLQENILEFTFLKDNGTIRKVATTLNRGILDDYYSMDKDFVARGLSEVDIFTSKMGGMTLSSKMNRGYIRVMELGSSRFDNSGTRSINLARLLKVEQVAEVSREFINVDLDSVDTAFHGVLNDIVVKNPSWVTPLARELIKGSSGEDLTQEQLQMTPVKLSVELRKYVDGRLTILSTEFRRYLHRFMIGHPEWFPTYTGLPLSRTNDTGENTGNAGGQFNNLEDIIGNFGGITVGETPFT